MFERPPPPLADFNFDTNVARLVSRKKLIHNICTTSAKRRRWSNILEMIYECFAFTGYSLIYSLNNLYETVKSPKLTQLALSAFLLI